MSLTARLAACFLLPPDDAGAEDAAAAAPAPAPARMRLVPVGDGRAAEPRGASAGTATAPGSPEPLAPAVEAAAAVSPPRAPSGGAGTGSPEPNERRVCVVGGGARGVALGAAVAAALARGSSARCALLVVSAAEGLPRARPALGPAAPAARRLARDLTALGPVVVRGRVAELRLDGAAPACAAVLAALPPRAAGVPVVLVLPGVRDPSADLLLGAQDVVVAAVDPGAPAPLAALAAAGLRASAPAASVRVVPVPARLGPAARRSAVSAALGRS